MTNTDQQVQEFADLLGDIPNSIARRAVEIEGLLAKYDPFSVLAQLAYLSLSMDRESNRDNQPDRLFLPIEYLAQLTLKKPYPNHTSPFIPAVDLERIQDLVAQSCQDTLNYYGFDGIGHIKGCNDADGVLRRRLTLNSLAVRTPGYPHHVREVLRGIFGGDNTLPGVLGFGIDEAIGIADAVVSITEQRRADRGAAAREFVQRSEQALEQYQHDPAGYSGDLVELTAAMVNRDDPQKAIREMASDWFMFCMSGDLMFTAGDIAYETGLGIDVVTRCLETFSQCFGTENSQMTMPAADHTLRTYPVLHHGKNYFCPIVELFLWAIQPRFEQALKTSGKKGAWESFDRRRAKYLEYTAVAALGKALRTADARTGLKYKFDDGEGGRDYELDGLIIRDKFLFLVEAKGGTISAQAHRGGQHRIRKHVEQLVGAPFAQAARAQRYVESAGIAVFRDHQGREVTVDSSALRRVFPIAVTLDFFGPLTAVLDETARTGLLGQEALGWAVALLDLLVICELIEFPSMLVHFLGRRLHLNDLHLADAPDELDWFGFYLKRGLDFEAESAEVNPLPHRIILGSHTGPIDDWYAHKLHLRNTPAPKPVQPMPAIMRETLSDIENTPFPERTQTVGHLLDMSGQMREEFGHKLQYVRSMTTSDGQAHDVTFVVTEAGWGLSIFATTPSETAETLQLAEAFGRLKKYQAHANSWTVLISVVGCEGVVHAVLPLDEPWQPDDALEEALRHLPVMGAPGETTKASGEE